MAIFTNDAALVDNAIIEENASRINTSTEHSVYTVEDTSPDTITCSSIIASYHDSPSIDSVYRMMDGVYS